VQNRRSNRRQDRSPPDRPQATRSTRPMPSSRTGHQDRCSVYLWEEHAGWPREPAIFSPSERASPRHISRLAERRRLPRLAIHAPTAWTTRQEGTLHASDFMYVDGNMHQFAGEIISPCPSSTLPRITSTSPSSAYDFINIKICTVLNQTTSTRTSISSCTTTLSYVKIIVEFYIANTINAKVYIHVVFRRCRQKPRRRCDLRSPPPPTTRPATVVIFDCRRCLRQDPPPPQNRCRRRRCRIPVTA
jgi:hypothetical protein